MRNMNRRPTQFGMRENAASSRRHASRTVVAPPCNANCMERTGLDSLFPFVQDNTFALDRVEVDHAPLQDVATGKREESHLLTVQEVARLLQVPTSWVYEHTRHRFPDRIPSLKLGKYLRFAEGDIATWLTEKRAKD